MARRRARKLPKEPYHAVIETLSHEGQGIARVDGKATFIHGALPGEEIMFQYTEKKSQYDKGICVEVIKSSADRTAPYCAHYNMCGGCSLQHLSSDKQVSHKQSALAEAFTHIAKVSPDNWLEPLTDKIWHYRDKARLSVRYVHKKDSVLVGFRERANGRFITDIESCAVLNQSVGLQIKALKELITSLEGYRTIAQIEVAIGHKQVALILRHLEELVASDLNKLRQFTLEHQVCWYLQPGGVDTIYPLDDNQEPLYYLLDDESIKMHFHPSDFTQVNAKVNEKMVHQALSLLDLSPTDTVLDLFCGLGNFSLPIAKRVKEVVGVEGCDKMVARAAENAARNQITNTQFFQADLFQLLENKPWLEKHYDKLLIDPPRTGAKELCEQIEKFAVNHIVYVSCSPQTLARDADILVNQKGYKMVSAGVMDMFPHTAHVESMALFVK